jgi:hypothetical protein
MLVKTFINGRLKEVDIVITVYDACKYLPEERKRIPFREYETKNYKKKVGDVHVHIRNLKTRHGEDSYIIISDGYRRVESINKKTGKRDVAYYKKFTTRPKKMKTLDDIVDCLLCHSSFLSKNLRSYGNERPHFNLNTMWGIDE